PLHGDQDGGVAPFGERLLVREVVGHAAVTVALAVDARRVGVKRRHIVRGEAELQRILDRPDIEEGALPVAQPGDSDPDRTGLRPAEPLDAHVAAEGAPVHLGETVGRMVAQQVADVEARHPQEGPPVVAEAGHRARRDRGALPRPTRDGHAEIRLKSELDQGLDDPHLESATRRPPREDQPDLAGRAEDFESWRRISVHGHGSILSIVTVRLQAWAGSESWWGRGTLRRSAYSLGPPASRRL